MSRIGKAPITVPKGVTVDLKGNDVKVKGPKGELTRTLRPEIEIKMEEDKLVLTKKNDDRLSRSLHGLSRTLVANMVKGVSDGFEKTLEMTGVGYRAQMEGTKLVMALGYSHPIEIEPPKGLAIAVGKGNVITVTGIDKQAVGDLASAIRETRPPEVYKGKGVRYKGEVIRRKAGKAAGKKK
ncbi:MAG: 50S ribosomal protein L6 [Candidatus Melainabacteria bacterium]|nr:MAG: 50S ribosomal protein L6 [Candidatus Melainabacteria bacterium]